MKFVGFDWDKGNLQKCAKHGVSSEEIESLFTDATLYVSSDAAHSLTETRLRAVGRAYNGRSVFLVFTVRRRPEGNVIRPISARYMHKKEVAYYEKEIPEF